MNITSISAAAVCISLIIITLRQIKPEMAQIVEIGAAVIIFICVIPYAAEAVKEIKRFCSFSLSGEKYIEPILKITGIAYVTNLGSELCSDAGEKALGSRVEMAGKIAICIITIPIAREAFEKITGIIK